jgi:hypothetical protein
VDDELAPIAVPLTPPVRPPPVTASTDTSVTDPEFLATHRRDLLALQRLSAAELAAQMRAPYRGDLAIATLYTVYALPLGAWVVLQSRHERDIGGPLAIVAFAALFGLVLWRAFFRSFRAVQRARIYEGRFVRHRVDVSVFDGGEILVPYEVQKALIPGVRYRIHGGGTEEIAVDVALDEIELERSAYR